MKNLYKILLVLCFLPMNANCNTSTQQGQNTASKDGSELTQEQKLQKVAELHENYEDMKEIKNSFENRLLGATGSATMGIGGMQLATSLSEDKADDAAEQQMKAYLETFRCNYSNGKNIKGGETNIELPGGNELINLYSEYVGLANDLKTRKNALGMRTGIESEPILDSATSGLYDDVSVGKTSGVFTSLARALSDPNSEDTAAWAAQREETAQKKKTALTTIGIGAVATVAGNILINHNNKKENRAAILAKYEKLTTPTQDLAKELAQIPAPEKCTGTNVTGTPPDCTCQDTSEIYSTDKGCTKKNNEEPTNECTNGIKADGKCISLTDDFKDKIGEFNTDCAFIAGKTELTKEAKTIIQTKKTSIEQALSAYNGQTFCLQIVGHTDRTGFKSCTGSTDTDCNQTKNQTLSEERAKTVLTELGLKNNDNVIAIGMGQNECISPTYTANDPNCRKITFEITEKDCANQQDS